MTPTAPPWLLSLSSKTGRSVDDLLELWNERAAIREVLGGYSRREAEGLAVHDVVGMLESTAASDG